MPSYDDIYNVFESKDCKLLTTREEFNNLTGRHKKYKYKASCGHEHEVFYNVFKSRNTGVICPNCVTQRNASASKEGKINDKLENLKLEKICIDYFIEHVNSTFHIIKAFDGCKADIITKPINIEHDCWIGIQVKSTHAKNNGYSFNLEQDYKDCIILCMCWEDKKIWLFPSKDVNHLTKISIGLKKSKYSQYEVTLENMIEKMLNFYDKQNKFAFDIRDTPVSVFSTKGKNF
jgi:hypothetical protein